MRPWIFLAGLGGVLAVGMGAYAAHGLAADAAAQALVERGSQYQLLHCLALLAADRVAGDGRRGGAIPHLAALLFLLGMVLFCGSLYWKALSGIPLPVPMVTPAGGMTLMAAWLVLAVAGLRR
ncbi:MAG: DUF423 domain-containing protein [Magnetospirillum sp.]|nr:DUF423 domain-containing protein [Magnetospirillum sp.]